MQPGFLRLWRRCVLFAPRGILSTGPFVRVRFYLGSGNLGLDPIMKRVTAMGRHPKVGVESHFDPSRNSTNLELFDEVEAPTDGVGRPGVTRSQAGDSLKRMMQKSTTVHFHNEGRK